MDQRFRLTTRHEQRRAFLQLLLAGCLLPVRPVARQNNDKAKAAIDNGVSFDAKTAAYHVYPNGRIQDALEKAAQDPVNKTVYVPSGNLPSVRQRTSADLVQCPA